MIRKSTYLTDLLTELKSFIDAEFSNYYTREFESSVRKRDWENDPYEKPTILILNPHGTGTRHEYKYNGAYKRKMLVDIYTVTDNEIHTIQMSQALNECFNSNQNKLAVKGLKFSHLTESKPATLYGGNKDGLISIKEGLAGNIQYFKTTIIV